MALYDKNKVGGPGKKPKPIYVDSVDDPRYKAYQDSLGRYNNAEYNKQLLENNSAITKIDNWEVNQPWFESSKKSIDLNDKLKIKPVEYNSYKTKHNTKTSTYQNGNKKLDLTSDTDSDLIRILLNDKTKEIYKNKYGIPIVPRVEDKYDYYTIPIFKKPVQQVEVRKEAPIPDIVTPKPTTTIDRVQPKLEQRNTPYTELDNVKLNINDIYRGNLRPNQYGNVNLGEGKGTKSISEEQYKEWEETLKEKERHNNFYKPVR